MRLYRKRVEVAGTGSLISKLKVKEKENVDTCYL